jgi:hypothetical protein
MRSFVIGGAAIAVAAGLYFVLRPDDTDEPVDTVAVTTTAPTTDTGATTVVPQPPQPPPPARVRIAVRGGVPVGGVHRVTVSRGRRVILVVTSDVADHLHLHGYDVVRDVAPGRPARIAFTARIVGTVEAELEDRGARIATITTRP